MGLLECLPCHAVLLLSRLSAPGAAAQRPGSYCWCRHLLGVVRPLAGVRVSYCPLKCVSLPFLNAEQWKEIGEDVSSSGLLSGQEQGR